MKMKELEERTGLGREAIRFYIREGLLPEPEKPRRNVAIYSEDHVGRIQLIKKLKDERFLPLGVIRELLENPGPGEIGTPNLVGLEFLLAARLGANRGETGPIKELIAATSLDSADIDALAQDGLITIRNEPDGPALSGQDARIARLWANVKDAGYDGGIGYSAHDMKRYKDAAEMLADQEVEHFYDRVPGTRSTDNAAALAQQGIALVEQMFSILHTKAILSRIARRNAEDTEHSPVGTSDTP